MLGIYAVQSASDNLESGKRQREIHERNRQRELDHEREKLNK